MGWGEKITGEHSRGWSRTAGSEWLASVGDARRSFWSSPRLGDGRMLLDSGAGARSNKCSAASGAVMLTHPKCQGASIEKHRRTHP